VGQPGKYAVLDLETRCSAAMARQVLHLEASIPDEEALRRFFEKRRAENHGSEFPKLPFHEPVAAAILLVERRGPVPESPLLATDWRCWRAGELPLEQFVERFFKNLAGRTYVGFNSQGFDLPLMELWASRCRITAPEHFDRLRNESPRNKYAVELHCDLQKELVNWAWGSGTFDELCRFHGLPGKPGVSGGDVEALLAQGHLDQVHAYNVTDVLQTHLLFLHTLVRSGRLTRGAAAESARAAIDLTRDRLLPKLTAGGEAFRILEETLLGCAKAPIALP
jgi:predicted PolB exonuclease-like 3'-5' exonuclease